jgi:uncharacterized protein YoxC
MTGLIAPLGSHLLQSVTALHDTVFTKAVGAERGMFEHIADIAAAINTLALLALTIVIATIAWKLRTAYDRSMRLLDTMRADLAPVVQQARSIGDDVKVVTRSIRSDMAAVDTTIADANRKLQEAIAATEQRMRDFNALLEVVQDEAEQMFVSTASTVRGMRRGAAAFQERGGTEFASDELEAAAVADALDIQEEGDGHDGSPESAAATLAAAPRVRPRTGQRRRA